MKLFLFATWASLLTGVIYQLYFKVDYRPIEGQKVASFYNIEGKVDIKPAGALARYEAKKSAEIFELDMIYTGNDSSTVLRFVDGSVLRVAPNSQIKISPKKHYSNEISIDLIKGDLKAAKVAPQAGASNRSALQNMKLSLQTPTQKFVVGSGKEALNLRFNIRTKKVNAKIGKKRVQGEAIQAPKFDTKDLKRPDLSKLVLNFKKPTEPVKIEAPPVPEPPKARPMRMVAKRPPPAPIEIPADKALLPVMSPKSGVFWSPLPLKLAIKSPLPLSYQVAKKNVPSNWLANFTVKVGNQERELQDEARSPSSFQLGFPLKRVAPSMTVRPGYILTDKPDSTEGLKFDSKIKSLYKFESLNRKGTVTVYFNNHNIKTFDGTWFKQKRSGSFNSQLTLFDGKNLSRLAPLLHSQNFKVVNTSPSFKVASFIVKKGEVIGAFKGKAPSSGQAMNYLELLDANLIFVGKRNDYLGQNLSLDTLSSLGEKKPLFYIHRGRPIKLDKSLIQSHDSAKDFLQRVNPNFVLGRVKVLAEKK